MNLDLLREKASRLEGLVKNKGAGRGRAGLSLACALRNWEIFRLSAEEKYARKALTLADGAAAANVFDFPARMLVLFLRLELGLVREAADNLAALKRHKAYFLEYEPRLYCQLMFCGVYADLLKNRAKAAAKKLRALAESGAKRGRAFLAAGCLLAGDYPSAGEALLAAFKEGDRSVFFFAALNEYFKGAESGADTALFSVFLRWGTANGLAPRYAPEKRRRGAFRMEEEGRFISEKGEIPAEELFKYEVSVDNPAADSVWVTEPEFRGAREYRLENGAAVVSAAGDNFSYYLWAEAEKSLMPGKARVKRPVFGAEDSLYRAYFDSGFAAPPELLAALAKQALALDSPGAEWISPLEKALAEPSLSRSFKARLGACLGGILAESGDYARAAAVYGGIDESLPIDGLAGPMLAAYLGAGEFERAAGLIAERAALMADKDLFNALRIILKQEIPSVFAKQGKALAAAAYRLIVGGWFDRTLLTLVLSDFNGSLAEWRALSEILDNMAAPEPGLDRSILRKSVWARVFDKGGQAVFARVYARGDGEDFALLRDYALYCAYEIIVNGKRPEYRTVDLLEKLDDDIIKIALCHYYISNGAQTPRSDGIIREALDYCEKNGLMFPVFRAIKDKSLISPYIEKNQPFMYRCPDPRKRVFLFCRFDGEKGAFKSLEMTRFRFGIFLAGLPVFTGESVSYYFEERAEKGSVSTPVETLLNHRGGLAGDSEDPYFAINNALIYAQLFEFDKAEEIIAEKLRDRPGIISGLM